MYVKHKLGYKWINQGYNFRNWERALKDKKIVKLSALTPAIEQIYSYIYSTTAYEMQ